MKPSCRRVLDALREGPRTTGELAEVGGVRFGARLEELRGMGYRITEERVRQSKHRYTLVSEPGQPAREPAAPIPTWGREKVCGRPGCGHRWQADGMWAGPCPSCNASMAWTEDHWSAADADLVAAEAKKTPAQAVESEAQKEGPRRVTDRPRDTEGVSFDAAA